MGQQRLRFAGVTLIVALVNRKLVCGKMRLENQTPSRCTGTLPCAGLCCCLLSCPLASFNLFFPHLMCTTPATHPQPHPLPLQPTHRDTAACPDWHPTSRLPLPAGRLHGHRAQRLCVRQNTRCAHAVLLTYELRVVVCVPCLFLWGARCAHACLLCEVMSASRVWGLSSSSTVLHCALCCSYQKVFQTAVWSIVTQQVATAACTLYAHTNLSRPSCTSSLSSCMWVTLSVTAHVQSQQQAVPPS